MDDSGSLLLAARQGDPRAQSELLGLLRRFARHVAGAAGNSLGCELDWEDVAQEAGQRLFDGALDRYDGRGSEEGYVYTVVKTTTLMMARGAGRRRDREESWGAGPESEEARTAGVDVASLLSRLDEACQELLQKVFLEDLPYSTLARETGLAASSLRAKVSRCLGRARAILD